MLKLEVLAEILVQAKWVRNLDDGRTLVANEFQRHRPRANLNIWNSHVGDDWAHAYITSAVASRPSQIRFDQAFDDLDSV